MNNNKIATLGALKKSNWVSKTIKEELRDNLIAKLKNKEKVFEGIVGFDNTVLPDIERAILSGHNILLLGLRGQAKTRIARLMVHLLDEYVPAIEGSALNDDPLKPLSRFAKDLIDEQGDKTPIKWIHRQERYVEKLATPDVSVADLIGDVDPIKAANMRLSYADERVIHFGLIPRSHRSIFVINELPDLQPRIQVALFNILQEGDIQIRGFNLRLPLEVQFVFTANPEDYTNRGSIVTPLKDRIESQILTHYPPTIELSKEISRQEARINVKQSININVPELIEDLIEETAFEARASEYVDEKSGVSARLTITARENLNSAAERRCLIQGDKKTTIRIGDLAGIIPSITGKIELVYEGEQEGPYLVAVQLIGKAIRKQFVNYFPDPEVFKKKKQQSPYQPIIDWFAKDNNFDLLNDVSNKDYQKLLLTIPSLVDVVETYHPKTKADEKFLLMEFLLHGLAEFSLIGKSLIQSGFQFKDLFGSMLNMDFDDDVYDEY